MSSGERPQTVLVYSDDVHVRTAVRAALGRRPAADLPLCAYEEFATEAALIRRLHEGGVDLVVLDGEAVPAGGMGIAKLMKTEVFNAPPVVLLIGRPQDAWLATWSQAEAVVPAPMDPVVLARAAAGLLRDRVALPSA